MSTNTYFSISVRVYFTHILFDLEENTNKFKFECKLLIGEFIHPITRNHEEGSEI